MRITPTDLIEFASGWRLLAGVENIAHTSHTLSKPLLDFTQKIRSR